MAYLGRKPEAGRFDKIDDISGSFNGVTTSFNLTINSALINVGRAEQLIISVGGVIQEPVTDYTISSYNTIEFTTAPESGDTFFGILLGDTFQAHTPMNRSVTGDALVDTILASGKTFKNLTLADSLSVTANTSITAQANVGATFTVDSGVANTNIYSDHLNITANTLLSGEVTITGGIRENWSIVNSNTTVSSNRNYFANTRNDLTLTLPSSATLGDAIRIVDNEGLASSNNITISRNGHNIQGQSANLSITTARAGITLVYESSRNGWVLRENF